MKMGMNLLSVVCRPQIHKKYHVRTPAFMTVEQSLTFLLKETINWMYNDCIVKGVNILQYCSGANLRNIIVLRANSNAENPPNCVGGGICQI